MEMGVEILQPKKTFRQLMIEKGWPNRFMRFCCKELKEYKVLDRSIIGVRRAESVSRSKRYTEPTECRFYGSKKEHVEAFYPILDWTNEDVAAFIEDRHIQCHPLYYDKNGKFDVTKRLGCLCCPLQSTKKRIEDFKQHPNMVKFYIKANRIFRKNHPDSKSVQMYSSSEMQFCRDLFYDSQSVFEDAYNGMFGDIDYKMFLETYFNIKL